jgi:Peptidase family M28
MTWKLVATLAIAVASPLAAQARSRPTQRPAQPVIDSMVLRAATRFLASDLLEGRGTGRRGNDIAAIYLAAEAQALGLVGAAPDGGYLQSVPLVEAVVDTARTKVVLTVGAPGGGATRETYSTPEAFVPNVGTAATLVPFGGDIAYVGSPRDVLAHPGALPDLVGRVALVRGPFGAEAAAADTLRARGVVGVVQLTPDSATYDLYVRSRGPSRMYIADSAHAASSFMPDVPDIIASPALGRALDPDLPAAGGEARPALLPGRRLELQIEVHARPLVSRNVAAILPGADRARRGEFVTFTAHLDHLGISTPDARGDSIYNGFSDNAAGCAMLLAIAKAMAAGPRPARSVLFLWLTGEERGLLGSDYFAAHPLISADSMVAEINLDAGAPPAPPVSWEIAGGDRSTLGALAVQVARRAGWTATVGPATPNSDYFPLLRIGVPAVFLVPGPAPFQGLTADSSKALSRAWEHYHQPSDEWRADFPFSGLVRYADFAYRVGMTAAAAPRPVLVTPGAGRPATPAPR